MVPGRGARGEDMRIPADLRVSTDTVWVLRTVSASRMTPGFAAVVVLSDGCSSGADGNGLSRAPASEEQFD